MEVLPPDVNLNNHFAGKDERTCTYRADYRKRCFAVKTKTFETRRAPRTRR